MALQPRHAAHALWCSCADAQTWCDTPPLLPRRPQLIPILIDAAKAEGEGRVRDASRFLTSLGAAPAAAARAAQNPSTMPRAAATPRTAGGAR